MTGEPMPMDAAPESPELETFAKRFMGHRVEVREVEGIESERPIARFSIAWNPAMSPPETIRFSEETAYTKGDYFPYRRRVRGTVVGIDTEDSSLIIRPRGPNALVFEKYWVKLVDANGNQLVEVDFVGRSAG